MRMRIAKALLGEKASPGGAARLLEGILRDRFSDTCTAEAAVELARIYGKAKRKDQAVKALAFAKQFLQVQAKRELSAEQVAPFLFAVDTAARSVGKPPARDVTAAEKLFQQAQKLRTDKKYAPAMGVYGQVIQRYKDTSFATRSLLHVGHCLLGQKQYAQAATHWRKFVDAAPAGPWRGHAFVGLIDLCLDELFDGAAAVKYADLAESSLPSAAASKAAKGSWAACGRSLRIRIGTVALLRGENAKAATVFARARKLSAKAATSRRRVGR